MEGCFLAMELELAIDKGQREWWAKIIGSHNWLENNCILN